MEKVSEQYTVSLDRPLEQVVRRGTVLVVDSSLEFVGTVKKLRAANLILQGKGYELISREDTPANYRYIDSIGDPLTLALNRYVSKRKFEIDPNSLVSKRMILNRDGYTCSYCGGFGNTVDHIKPRARGGLSTWGNLTTACKECNGKKGDLSLQDVGYATPYIPKVYTPRKNLELQEAIYGRLALMSY